MWLVLFDIDGTLLRARGEPVRKALQEALQVTLKRAVPIELLGDLAGKTDTLIFAEVARQFGAEEHAVQRSMTAFARAYEQAYRRYVHPGDIRLLPGAEEVLASLEALPGIALGLLTGNLRSVALWKLRAVGLSRYFLVGAFGSDHWERSLLVPIAWQRARMMGLPIEPSRTIVVGDSVRDVACARAWGVPCIAVATGSTSAARLQVAGARVVLPELSVEAFWSALHELCA
ncbi:MAG: HAD family hydrolase [Chlorobiota bacterium]